MRYALLLVSLMQDQLLQYLIDAELRRLYDSTQTRVFRLASSCPPA
jgi:hypothetical protein